jgi:hypothetical protein
MHSGNSHKKIRLQRTGTLFTPYEKYTHCKYSTFSSAGNLDAVKKKLKPSEERAKKIRLQRTETLFTPYEKYTHHKCSNY